MQSTLGDAAPTIRWTKALQHAPWYTPYDALLVLRTDYNGGSASNEEARYGDAIGTTYVPVLNDAGEPITGSVYKFEWAVFRRVRVAQHTSTEE